MIDSGIRMTSLNEDANFGDLFFSYQKDLNIGAKFFTTNSRERNLSLEVEKLFSAGKKVSFMMKLDWIYRNLFLLNLIISPL